MSTDGLLFKAVSGTAANLRWDLPQDQLQYSFKRENHKKNDSWPLLYAFSQGISGGGAEEPSLWVFDNVDLPPVRHGRLWLHLCMSTRPLAMWRCTAMAFVANQSIIL